MGKQKTVVPPTTARPETPQPQQVPQPQPTQSMDIKDAINKMVQNTMTIRDHIIAIKMIGKGLDITALEIANNENSNLIVALSNYIRGQMPAARVPNRKERREMERQARKLK